MEAQAGSPAFANPGEIARRSSGLLRAVVQISETTRPIPNVAPSVMRYFQGWDPADPSKKAPQNPAIAGPGPTLRAEVGAAAGDTWMVGDSYVDVQTARNAGAWSIGCDFGFGERTLMATPPDVMVDTAADWTAALSPAKIE